MALADLLRSGSTDDDVPDDASELLEDLEGDGLSDELPEDPQPSRRGRQRRTRVRAANPQQRRTSKAENEQVKDALTMLYSLPAWGFQLRDPHCGQILVDQRDDILKTLTPIVCRNPAMLAFFTASNAPWLEYLALAKALWPVVTTVWGHHVTHTIGADAAEGGPVDLSAYSATVY